MCYECVMGFSKGENINPELSVSYGAQRRNQTTGTRMCRFTLPVVY